MSYIDSSNTHIYIYIYYSIDHKHLFTLHQFELSLVLYEGTTVLQQGRHNGFGAKLL